MKFQKTLSLTLLAGTAAWGLGLFAQDAPPANQRPMQHRMQEHRGAGMMEGHQEIADAVAQIRENVAALRQETDMAKIQAGLAENEKLLSDLESKMASRRTMMQLRMGSSPQGDAQNHEGHE